MKIVSIISKPEYSKENLSQLESMGEFVNIDAKKLDAEEIVTAVADADVLLVGGSGVTEIRQDVLSKLPNLKLISVLGVGTDFIDLDAAAELNIKVAHLVGANSQSVAEHTWGLIFSLSKRINESHLMTKQENKYEFWHYPGIELQGKTIGIVGYGEIGSRVAKIARAIDMKVIANSRTTKDLSDVDFVDLDELLQKADVIVLTIPLTPETNNLLGKEQFEKMKKNVIIVNPSREEFVDKEALFENLSSGKIFGYGVELNINTPADPRYYEFKNVITTPHTGFFTAESEDKSNTMGIDNIRKFLEGKPENLIN